MLSSFLIHLLVLALVLWIVFEFLLPLITDGRIRMIVQVIVVLLAIISLLRYIPGAPVW